MRLEASSLLGLILTSSRRVFTPKRSILDMDRSCRWPAMSPNTTFAIGVVLGILGYGAAIGAVFSAKTCGDCLAATHEAGCKVFCDYHQTEGS